MWHSKTLDARKLELGQIGTKVTALRISSRFAKRLETRHSQR
jgi:hypothetical protein